jgi:hypothetical protein
MPAGPTVLRVNAGVPKCTHYMLPRATSTLCGLPARGTAEDTKNHCQVCRIEASRMGAQLVAKAGT